MSIEDEEGEMPRGDFLDGFNTRSLAMVRFALHHDTLATIFDPWRVENIWDGSKRAREDMNEAGSDGSRVSEIIRMKRRRKDGGGMLLAGMASRSDLMSSRIEKVGATGPEPIPLETRKDRLTKILEKIQGDTSEAVKKHGERLMTFDDKERTI